MKENKLTVSLGCKSRAVAILGILNKNFTLTYIYTIQFKYWSHFFILYNLHFIFFPWETSFHDISFTGF